MPKRARKTKIRRRKIPEQEKSLDHIIQWLQTHDAPMEIKNAEIASQHKEAAIEILSKLGAALEADDFMATVAALSDAYSYFVGGQKDLPQLVCYMKKVGSSGDIEAGARVLITHVIRRYPMPPKIFTGDVVYQSMRQQLKEAPDIDCPEWFDPEF